jgi:hypothetical protein
MSVRQGLREQLGVLIKSSLKYYNTFDNKPCNRGSIAAEIRKIAEKLKVQIEHNRSKVKQVQDSLVQHHLFPG